MLMYKEHVLIMNEKEVTTVLSTINRNRKMFDYVYVDYLNDADDIDKWYIRFKAFDKSWTNILDTLNRLGTITIKVKSDGKDKLHEHIYFERRGE